MEVVISKVTDEFGILWPVLGGHYLLEYFCVYREEVIIRKLAAHPKDYGWEVLGDL